MEEQFARSMLMAEHHGDPVGLAWMLYGPAGSVVVEHMASCLLTPHTVGRGRESKKVKVQELVG